MYLHQTYTKDQYSCNVEGDKRSWSQGQRSRSNMPSCKNKGLGFKFFFKLYFKIKIIHGRNEQNAKSYFIGAQEAQGL